MVLCEAAGFDVVIVETVGVGQSEIAVADMVDFFLVLLLAGGGDDLQGIKKGIIEIADMIAINKADGDNVTRAERAAAEYRAALQILHRRRWSPPVITISGRKQEARRAMDKILDHRDKIASGEFEKRRQTPGRRLDARHAERPGHGERLLESAVAERLPSLEAEVRQGVCCRRWPWTRS